MFLAALASEHDSSLKPKATVAGTATCACMVLSSVRRDASRIERSLRMQFCARVLVAFVLSLCRYQYSRVHPVSTARTAKPKLHCQPLETAWVLPKVRLAWFRLHLKYIYLHIYSINLCLYLYTHRYGYMYIYLQNKSGITGGPLVHGRTNVAQVLIVIILFLIRRRNKKDQTPETQSQNVRMWWGDADHGRLYYQLPVLVVSAQKALWTCAPTMGVSKKSGG